MNFAYNNETQLKIGIVANLLKVLTAIIKSISLRCVLTLKDTGDDETIKVQ